MAGLWIKVPAGENIIDDKGMQRITSRAILARHLCELVRLDDDLVPVLERAGDVPLRTAKPGFAGLASIVVGQLLSVASARAIMGRVENLVGEMSGERFLATERDRLRAAGLSFSKIDCLRGVAEAEIAGELDFSALGDMPEQAAVETLMRLKGIGRWSAQIYLLSCIGHPDVFPAGDLALQKMVGRVKNMSEKPDEKVTRRLACQWAPYRASAARLLWRYFAVLRQREGINL